MTFDPDQLLDDVGRRLLRELQADARLSYAELGRRVGLSAPAAADRMRRLEEAGVVTGYRAVVDPVKLGYAILALVRVTVRGDSMRLSRFAVGLAQVVECHRVTGDECIVLKVVAASMADLERLVDRLLPFGQPSTSIVYSSSVTDRTIEGLPPGTRSDRGGGGNGEDGAVMMDGSMGRRPGARPPAGVDDPREGQDQA